MFTIIISEKGGAERREAFDKNEINVGRVQGNDLMLPKGNVSKHHARLLYRDSRFIVTDLKSTNGTYVNGRKISQATIVREGDKIYVGDFVLRLETAQQVPSVDSSQPIVEDSQSRTPARPGSPRDGSQPSSASPLPQALAAVLAGTPPGLVGSSGAGPASSARTSEVHSGSQVSHYPLERDPDDSESAPDLAAGLAGKLQNSTRAANSQERAIPRTNAAPIMPRGGPRGSAALASRSMTSPASSTPVPLRETPQQSARRLALITLVDRVSDVVNVASLVETAFPDPSFAQQIEQAIREQAKAMLDEGEAPSSLDLELLAQDALREFVGLGPLGPLLDDEETSEIQVPGPDYVLAWRNGQASLADAPFTSDTALARVVARLAHQTGQPLSANELVVERRLGRGIHMVAISPLAATGWVLSIRKRQRIEATLDDLVRAGAMSSAVAAFLETCVQARANVLVVGSGSGVVATMVAALASAVAAGERIVVLQDADEIAVPHAQVIPISLVDRGERGEQSVRGASRLGADRLIVASLAGAIAAATIEAIGEGCDGVLAGLGAPSLRQGLGRMVSQVALARPGASIEAAREGVGESFDVAVEITLGAQGRMRILRVGEVVGADEKSVMTRDLFVLSADGSGESAFVATGAVPRFIDEFAARGVRLDAAMFKRR